MNNYFSFGFHQEYMIKLSEKKGLSIMQVAKTSSQPQPLQVSVERSMTSQDAGISKLSIAIFASVGIFTVVEICKKLNELKVLSSSDLFSILSVSSIKPRNDLNQDFSAYQESFRHEQTSAKEGLSVLAGRKDSSQHRLLINFYIQTLELLFPEQMSNLSGEQQIVMVEVRAYINETGKGYREIEENLFRELDLLKSNPDEKIANAAEQVKEGCQRLSMLIKNRLKKEDPRRISLGATVFDIFAPSLTRKFIGLPG